MEPLSEIAAALYACYDTVAMAWQYHANVDENNALSNGTTDVRYRKLTTDLATAAATLRELADNQVAADSEQA